MNDVFILNQERFLWPRVTKKKSVGGVKMMHYDKKKISFNIKQKLKIKEKTGILFRALLSVLILQ